MPQYRGYDIEEKRDFGKQGFVIDGFEVKHGYIVVKNHCLAMPGGAWFLTVQDAKNGIDDLIASGDGQEINFRDSGGRKHKVDGQHYPIAEFHMRTSMRRAVGDRSLPLYRAIRQHLAQTADATGGATGDLAKLLAEIEDAVDMRTSIQPVSMNNGRIVEGKKTREGVFSPVMREILDEGIDS